VHYSTILKEKSNNMQQGVNFVISYLYEAQRVLGDTPSIIRRSLKLHWQPLFFHTWKFVGRVVGGLCQAHYEKVPNAPSHNVPVHIQQPSTYKNQRFRVQF
jgi:hypothetical protein